MAMRSSRFQRSSDRSSNVSNTEFMEEDESVMNPNAFVEFDPKPILLQLQNYSREKDIKCHYRKNANKAKLEIPVTENLMVNFWVIFEKGRKKNNRGLYKLSFHVESQTESDMFSSQDLQSTQEIEFLCTGFL